MNDDQEKHQIKFNNEEALFYARILFERTFLAWALVDESAGRILVDEPRIADFAVPVHAEIYEALVRATNRRTEISALHIVKRLPRQDDREDALVISYIHTLAELGRTFTEDMVDFESISNLALRARIYAIGSAMIDGALAGFPGGNMVAIEQFQQDLHELLIYTE